MTTYRNGDVIPQVTDPASWAGLTTGTWCYYNNDSVTGNTYGKLYNWYAINDPRVLAPAGYHVPTDEEWTILTDYLGGETVSGGKMKEFGLCHWVTPNSGATNESNFRGLPGGIRYFTGGIYGIEYFGFWWSSSEKDASDAWNRSLNFNNDDTTIGYSEKYYGLSVRVIKED